MDRLSNWNGELGPNGQHGERSDRGVTNPWVDPQWADQPVSPAPPGPVPPGHEQDVQPVPPPHGNRLPMPVVVAGTVVILVAFTVVGVLIGRVGQDRTTTAAGTTPASDSVSAPGTEPAASASTDGSDEAATQAAGPAQQDGTRTDRAQTDRAQTDRAQTGRGSATTSSSAPPATTGTSAAAPASTTYRNARYGFSVDVPEWLTEGREPANGDGAVFTGRGGTLTVSGSNGVAPTSPWSPTP